MVDRSQLAAPLVFTPAYQNVVWGGRRMERWRDDLPDGPVGESWDISQQERGMSVVESGPLAGVSLAELMRDHGAEVVGECYRGGDFPLLVKLIDANDRLSVQVHPDDELAQRFDRGPRGKTECWFILGEGGELFQGTRDGVDAEDFRKAIDDETVEACLNRFETHDGEFYFIPARTIHALGTGTLLYEIQQSSDCTFRVYDWGRVGMDGKPRELHIEESLQTVDFSDQAWGPHVVDWQTNEAGGRVRPLVRCDYFEVEERRAEATSGGDGSACSIVILLAGQATLSSNGHEIPLAEMRSYLVPAIAGEWSLQAQGGEARFLVARPR